MPTIFERRAANLSILVERKFVGIFPESRISRWFAESQYYRIVCVASRSPPFITHRLPVRPTMEKQWQKSDHLLLGNKIIGGRCVTWGIIFVIFRPEYMHTRIVVSADKIFRRIRIGDYIIMRDIYIYIHTRAYTRAWFSVYDKSWTQANPGRGGEGRGDDGGKNESAWKRGG